MNTSSCPSVRRLGSVIAVLTLIASAPAHGWAQTTAGQVPAVKPAPKVETTLEAENNNWLDVHVYLVRDGMVTSLGFLTGPGRTEFRLPAMATMPGGDVQFLVLPIGGLDSYLSPVAVVNPGDKVRLVVENHLALSTLVVTPGG